MRRRPDDGQTEKVVVSEAEEWKADEGDDSVGQGLGNVLCRREMRREVDRGGGGSIARRMLAVTARDSGGRG